LIPEANTFGKWPAAKWAAVEIDCPASQGPIIDDKLDFAAKACIWGSPGRTYRRNINLRIEEDGA